VGCWLEFGLLPAGLLSSGYSLIRWLLAIGSCLWLLCTCGGGGGGWNLFRIERVVPQNPQIGVNALELLFVIQNCSKDNHAVSYMFAPLPWSNDKFPTVQFCSINDSVGKHSSKNKGTTHTVGTCSSRPAGSVSACVGFWCPKSKCARTQHAYGMITCFARVYQCTLCASLLLKRIQNDVCKEKRISLPQWASERQDLKQQRLRNEDRRRIEKNPDSLSLFCCWQILSPLTTLNTCWGHCWYWCWCWHWCYSWQPVGQKCCRA